MMVCSLPFTELVLAPIRSDQDLILAVQDSIMSALEKHGITNRGEVSLRDAALKWLEKKANRDYFNTLIAEEQYAWTFGGNDVDAVIDRLQKWNSGADCQNNERHHYRCRG